MFGGNSDPFTPANTSLQFASALLVDFVCFCFCPFYTLCPLRSLRLDLRFTFHMGSGLALLYKQTCSPNRPALNQMILLITSSASLCAANNHTLNTSTRNRIINQSELLCVRVSVRACGLFPFLS